MTENRVQRTVPNVEVQEEALRDPEAILKKLLHSGKPEDRL